MNNFNRLVPFLLFLNLFTSFSVFSFDYKWPPYVAVIVPDSLVNEDAFFIRKTTTFDFSDNYQSSILFFERICINSNKGVEDFSTFELPIYNSGRLDMVKSRIIKATGQIIEISGNNIKETYFKGKFDNENKNLKRIQFIYPDLQKGDVIDIAYDVVFPYYIFSEMLYLESYLPSLYSKITLRNMSPLQIAVFTVNNAVPYKFKEETFTWEKEGVSVKKEEGFNAIRPNFPRFYYAMFPPTMVLTYGTIYSMDTDTYPVVRFFEKKLSSKMIDQNLYSETDSTFVKIEKLINAFKNSQWLDEDEMKNSFSTLNYFDQGVINENLFFKYLQQFFDENRIEYERCFTNTISDGPFNKNILSYTQFEHRYLTVKDYEGNYHYIFPPSAKGHFYKLDEIPYYCEGNGSVLMKGTDISLKEMVDLPLPESKLTENKHTTQIRCKFDKNNTFQPKYNRKDLLSGHFSNLIRTDQQDFWIEELGISDTSHTFSKEQAIYPFEIEIKQDSLENTFFQEIGDSLFWFACEKSLPKYIFDSNTSAADLGDYLVLPFKHLRTYSFYVENENGIKSEEQESLISYSNTVGEVSSKCVQMTSTVMKIEYTIKLKTRIIDGNSQVKEYLDFVQKWEEVRNKKWILKM